MKYRSRQRSYLEIEEKNTQNTAEVSFPLYNKREQKAQEEHMAHPLQSPQTTHTALTHQHFLLYIWCHVTEILWIIWAGKDKTTNYVTKYRDF